MNIKNLIKEELNKTQIGRVNTWVKNYKKEVQDNHTDWNGDTSQSKYYSAHQYIPGREHEVPPKEDIPLYGERLSGHVFSGSRTTIPLSDPNDKKLDAPADISTHLANHQIKVTDYVAGTGEDKHGRIVKLGKALSQTKAHPDLVNKFNSDPARANARLHNNLQVVITRDPHDVAAASTGRSWTSCIHMNGMNSHYLKDDIRHGTHVAYLTQQGDHEIKNPLARIRLIPYHGDIHNKKNPDHGKEHTILLPDSKYGNAASSFEHTVNSWVNQHFPAHPDVKSYEVPESVYNDNDYHTHVPKVSDRDVKKLARSPNWSEPAKLVSAYRFGNNAKHKEIIEKKWPTIAAKYGNEAVHERLLNRKDSDYDKHADRAKEDIVMAISKHAKTKEHKARAFDWMHEHGSHHMLASIITWHSPSRETTEKFLDHHLSDVRHAAKGRIKFLDGLEKK